MKAPFAVVAALWLAGAAPVSADGGGMHPNPHPDPDLPSFHGYRDHELEHNLVLSQVAVGGPINTSVILHNLGHREDIDWIQPHNLGASGTIYFYSPSGEPLEVSVNGSPAVSEHTFELEPGETRTLELTSAGPVTVGWALVEVDETDVESFWGIRDDQPIMRGGRLIATAFYTINDEAGVPLSRVGVVPSKYQRGMFLQSMLPARVSRSASTGVAIVNVGGEDAEITLWLRDSEGVRVASKVVLLAAGNQMARFISETFAGQVGDDFQGVLEVSSDSEGIVAMGLLMTGDIMTSIPTHHYGRWEGPGMMP